MHNSRYSIYVDKSFLFHKNINTIKRLFPNFAQDYVFIRNVLSSLTDIYLYMIEDISFYFLHFQIPTFQQCDPSMSSIVTFVWQHLRSIFKEFQIFNRLQLFMQKLFSRETDRRFVAKSNRFISNF